MKVDAKKLNRQAEAKLREQFRVFACWFWDRLSIIVLAGLDLTV